MRMAAVAGALMVAAGGAAAWAFVGNEEGDDRPSPSEPPGPSPEGVPVIQDLRAAPTALDEGDWVELVASASPGEDQSEGTLRYSWDFGDGSEPREGTGLTSIRHQYTDGDQETEVRLRVRGDDGGEAERHLLIKVRNVPPEIRSIRREGRGIVGERIGFRASAFDPGLADELAYAWEFGDGSTADGPSVEHAFDEAGSYDVRLVVTDGDGGRDEETLRLRIGVGYAFTVSGDVSGRSEGRMSVAGRVGGESSAFRDGYCAVLLGLRPERTGPSGALDGWGAGLTASLRGGLREASWPLGRKEARVRPWRDESTRPGVFFGDLENLDAGRSEMRFHVVSGTFEVAYLDDDWMEGSFVAEVEEDPLSYDFEVGRRPRTATVEGEFVAELGDEIGGYHCAPPETFAVERQSPARNATNVDLENPVIEVEFSAPVDRSTVEPGRFVLEYRLPDGGEGPYRALEGEISFPDDRTVRLTPRVSLPDGTLLCLRIRAGADGVRGVDGEILEAAPPPPAAPRTRTLRACHAGGRPWDEAYEWGFGTMVELESVRADLYQVARVADDIPLVPGKPTVARVFGEWAERDDIHPDAQVLSFPARVWVEANGSRIYPPRSGVEIRRPDQYGERDRREARNSVNFFDWRPRGSGASDVRARLEPADQSSDPPRVFESPETTVEHWEHRPTFTFDYHFLRLREWSLGVPPGVRSAGRILADRTEVYTTQMFPVLATRGREGHDLHVSFGTRADAAGWELAGTAFDEMFEPPEDESREAMFAAQSLAAFVELLTDQVAPHTDANALVIYHPGFYREGGNAYLEHLFTRRLKAEARGEDGGFTFRTATIYPRGDVYRTTALTHEFAHSFWLQHEPEVGTREARRAECAEDRGRMAGIEGFRVRPSGRGGWSKSSSDGNAESERRLYPLMYPCTQLFTESFIMNRHYADLVESVDGALSLGSYTGEVIARAGEAAPPVRRASVLPLSGLATVGAGAFRVPQEVGPGPNSHLRVGGLIDPADGSAALLPVRTEATAREGVSTAEGPYRLSLEDGDGREMEGIEFGLAQADVGEDGGAPAYFSLSVPRPDGVEAVTLREGDRRLAALRSSPSAPEVRILEPEPGAVAPDSLTLAWSSEDADGDVLLHTVLYSPTGAHPWRAVAAIYADRSLRVDASMLEPGPEPTLRVIATDGFREGEARVPIDLAASFPAVTLFPAEGDTVGPDVEPMAFLKTDVAPEALDGALLLRSGEGTPVSANVTLDAAAGYGFVLPLEPLEPGPYTFTVRAGLQDRAGSALGDDVTVRFFVEGADSMSGGDASVRVEDDRPSDDEVAELERGATRWLSVAFDGRPELSFSGSSLDGAATADIRCTPGSQAMLTFMDGPVRDSSTVQLQMTTAEIIPPGETGTFELEQIMVIRQGQAPGVYYGFGSVEISVHEAPDAPDAVEGHRISGRLRDASVQLEGGERVGLEIEFDAVQSCANSLGSLIGRG